MPHLIYAEAKSWQGAIGSLLGFIALMAGALWNFHLNRRRDAALRQEETVSVAAAVYSEIILLRKEIARLAASSTKAYNEAGMKEKPLTKFDRHFLAENTLSEPILYKASAQKIGLLSPALLLPIVEFYRNRQEASKWLPLQIEEEDRKYSRSILTVLIPACDATTMIEACLRDIELMLGITVAAVRPSLGEAETLIDIEEEFWRTPWPPDPI